MHLPNRPVVLLAAAARRAEDWSATVLALGLVPIALELTSYYWAALLAYAFLWGRQPWIGAALCALSAAGWGIADRRVFYDEVFPWISLATVAFAVFVTSRSLALPGESLIPSALRGDRRHLG